MAGGLMVIDTASLYFRAFFGVPESVKAPDGTPVNAVRGLLDMLAQLVTRFPPERLVCCDDFDWRPDFRVAAIPSYKAHRVASQGPDGWVEEVPAALVPQVPVIWEVLAAIGIAAIGVDGFEADDVLGTLAARDPGPVDVVSGDRDLLQVVDDTRGVRVLYCGRGVAKLEVMDDAAVRAKYGVPGAGYADMAALRGDPSDGLPGVPGVGEKTAAALVARFGSVEGILAALDGGVTDGFPAGARTKVAAAREYLAAAPEVVRVRRDVPIPDDLDDALPGTPADPEALIALVDRWGIRNSVNRLLAAVGVTV
ncbi:MAG: 5'-3' exonuclease H3TH domain-containing protein [Mycobacteriales bacterium]